MVFKVLRKREGNFFSAYPEIGDANFKGAL